MPFQSLKAKPPADGTLPPTTLQDVRALIVSRQIKVTSKVERVLRFALEHPSEIAFGTARGLASQCDVSNATIARAASLFGFQNFHEFRELFRMEVRRARPGRTPVPPL